MGGSGGTAAGGSGGSQGLAQHSVPIALHRTSSLQEQPHGACWRHIADGKAPLANLRQRAGRMRCLQSRKQHL